MLQDVLAIFLAAACGAAVLYQAVGTLRGKPNRVGRCCATGCALANVTRPTRPAERVVFLPADLLRK